MTGLPEIDVIVPLRPEGRLTLEARAALDRQPGVVLRLYEHQGPEMELHETVEQTVARCRNECKSFGYADWVLFLDDDVVLPNGSLRPMIDFLRQNENYGYLGINYRGDNEADQDPLQHILMGATLWRRHVLEAIEFTTSDHSESMYFPWMHNRWYMKLLYKVLPGLKPEDDGVYGCECFQALRSVRKLGYVADYAENVIPSSVGRAVHLRDVVERGGVV